MTSFRSTLQVLVALTALAAPGLAQRTTQLQQAYVDTLEVTKNLGTRGSLGGLCVDESGNIYVANFRQRVWKITPGGRGRILNRDFAATSGNSIAPDGRLIQSDFGLNRVYSVNKQTGNRTLLLNQGLNGPVGVVVTEAGDIFVANCNGQDIRRDVPGTRRATSFATSPLFNCPNGMVMGPTGDLFVINFFDNNLLRVDPTGAVTLHATPGTMDLGGGHIVRVGEKLYVTMFNSHALYSVSMSGQVELVAGKEGVPGLSDGAASHARLRYPNGIGADPSGRILYTNNLEGPRGGVLPGLMRIRQILVP